MEVSESSVVIEGSDGFGSELISVHANSSRAEQFPGSPIPDGSDTELFTERLALREVRSCLEAQNQSRYLQEKGRR